MGNVAFLRVAWLIAMMHTTVEGSSALVGALKDGSPFVGHFLTILANISLPAFLLVFPITTEDSLFDLSTVTTSIYSDFASATQSLVTWALTDVFTARHDFPTHLRTAPSILVIRIDTSSGLRLPTAEA